MTHHTHQPSSGSTQQNACQPHPSDTSSAATASHSTQSQSGGSRAAGVAEAPAEAATPAGGAGGASRTASQGGWADGKGGQERRGLSISLHMHRGIGRQAAQGLKLRARAEVACPAACPACAERHWQTGCSRAKTLRKRWSGMLISLRVHRGIGIQTAQELRLGVRAGVACPSACRQANFPVSSRAANGCTHGAAASPAAQAAAAATQASNLQGVYALARLEDKPPWSGQEMTAAR
eukprot:1141402-Pelagomonas_calceolata.AAC.3